MDEKCLSEAFSYYLSFLQYTYIYYSCLLYPLYYSSPIWQYIYKFFPPFSQFVNIDGCWKKKFSPYTIWLWRNFSHKYTTIVLSIYVFVYCSSSDPCSTQLLLHVKLKCGLTWKPCSLLQLEFKSWSIGLASWSMYSKSLHSAASLFSFLF